MDEDPFARNVQGFNKIHHEVIFLLKFLHTKAQIKGMNIVYYDLYYNVIKNRDEKEIVDNQYETDSIDWNDIIPNHYFGGKNDIVILR